MIRCKAIEERSLFVTARGDILPCCFIHRSGPNLNSTMQTIADDHNFENLVSSWKSEKPFITCYHTCSDETVNNPNNMKNFDSQWKNSDDTDVL